MKIPSHKKDSLKGISLFLIVAAVVLGMFFIYYTSSDTVEVEILKRERVVSVNSDKTMSAYLVFTDKEVFECRDDILFLKFNSSDIYGKLSEGKKYKIRVVGFRIPFFSLYRNILSVEAVNDLSPGSGNYQYRYNPNLLN